MHKTHSQPPAPAPAAAQVSSARLSAIVEAAYILEAVRR
jgi:hypothetical protein